MFCRQIYLILSQSCVDYFVPFLFHMNFAVSLSKFMKNYFVISVEIALKYRLICEELTTLSFPIQEHNIFWPFNILCSFFFFYSFLFWNVSNINTRIAYNRSNTCAQHQTLLDLNIMPYISFIYVLLFLIIKY